MKTNLRLKASGDVTQRTSDPNMQKIFLAMQKYVVIVDDNGSDMYITGNYFFFQENDGIRDPLVTGVQTCALPISPGRCLTMDGLLAHIALPRVDGKDDPVRSEERRVGKECRSRVAQYL